MNFTNYRVAVVFLYVVFSLSGESGFSQGIFQVRFHGIVNFEMFYDTRQVVAAREGIVMLFPAAEVTDADGNDLNAVPAFHVSLLTSRLQSVISGPQMLGAKSSALMEVDFLGTAHDKFSLLRMRHALLKLNWEKTELLAGQYWHPLFIPSVYPGVVHFGGAVPYNILNRSPQVRFTYQAGKFSLMAAILSQNDFSSPGPLGNSSIYLRNSGMPETWMQIIFEKNRFLAGASAGVLTLRPRIQTARGYQTNQTITSLAGNVFAKYLFEKFQIKALGTWGQNLNHLIMLGGYGEAELIDADKGIYNYTGIRSMAGWIDMETTTGRWRAGLFGGYSKNLGSNKPISGQHWARGGNISNIYRIAPRIGYFIERASFNLEFVYDAASYGQPDNQFRFDQTKIVSNLRTQVGIKYSF